MRTRGRHYRGTSLAWAQLSAVTGGAAARRYKLTAKAKKTKQYAPPQGRPRCCAAAARLHE